MIIETPKPSDLQEMVDLGQQMWSEGVFTVTEDYDALAALEFGIGALTEHLSGGDFYLSIAREKEGGEIIGMIVGQSVPYFFAPSKKMIVDHLIYVREDKRGTSAAYRLMKHFEAWSETRDAIEMSLGVSTGINPEKVHDFYIKMGYTHTGGIYKKPLSQSKKET